MIKFVSTLIHSHGNLYISNCRCYFPVVIFFDFVKSISDNFSYLSIVKTHIPKVLSLGYYYSYVIGSYPIISSHSFLIVKIGTYPNPNEKESIPILIPTNKGRVSNGPSIL